jgi:aspartate kinase
VQSRKIFKFGGTSLKDSSAILNCLEIVKDQRPQWIVVSATAQSTNQLEQMANVISSGREARSTAEILGEYNELAKKFSARHQMIAEELKLGERASLFLRQKAQELDQIAQDSLNQNQNVTLQLKDKLSSYGELISSQLFWLAATKAEIQMQLIDAREIIVTQARAGGAAPNLNQTQEKIQLKQKSLENDQAQIAPLAKSERSSD